MAALITDKRGLPLDKEFSVDQAEKYLYVLGDMQRKLADVIRGQVFSFPPEPYTGMKRPAWRSMVFFLNAERRYILYLDLLKVCLKDKVDPLPLPPWDVAMVFNSHLLNPYKFHRDLVNNGYQELWDAQIGFPVEPLFMRALRTLPPTQSMELWSKAYPDEEYDYFAQVGLQKLPTFGQFTCSQCKDLAPMELKDAARMCFSNTNQFSIVHDVSQSKHVHISRLSPRTLKKGQFQFHPHLREMITRPWFDLSLASWRQLGPTSFVTKITSYIHPNSESKGDDRLQTGLERYVQFMELLRDTNKVLVPTLDIDLFWHTHQVSPLAYKKYYETHIGKWINHDDTIPEKNLSRALKNTQDIWAEQFSEMYTSNDDKATQKETLTARKELYDTESTALNKKLRDTSIIDPETKWKSEIKAAEKEFEEKHAKLRQDLDNVRLQRDKISKVIDEKRDSISPQGETLMKRMPFYSKICEKRVKRATREDEVAYQNCLREANHTKLLMEQLLKDKKFKIDSLEKKKNDEVRKASVKDIKLRANIARLKNNISNCAPCTQQRMQPSFTTPDLTIAISSCWGVSPYDQPKHTCDDPKCPSSSSGHDSGYSSGSGGNSSGGGYCNDDLDWSGGGGISSACGTFTGSACATSSISSGGGSSSSSNCSSSTSSSSGCGSSNSSSCGSSSSSGCGSSSW